MHSLPLRLMIAGLALPLMAGAQVKPVPPAKPVPPTPASPLIDWVAPMPPVPVEPLLPEMPMMPLEFDMRFEVDQERFHELQWRTEDMEFRLGDLANIDAERMAMRAEEARFKAEELAHKAAAVAPLTLEGLGKLSIWQADELLSRRPRESWAQSDPADSLYRLAREALNRGEYRRSAQLFSEITKRFPKSQYTQDCAYWEAFSRYRLGGTDDLKQALTILDGIDVERMMRVSRESAVDIPALRARLQGALAARGDKTAEENLKREAAQSGGCDREAVSVRAEALGALGQMDMQAAMPAARKVLANRDECTVELRRRALYLVGRQADAEAATIILDVARNDTDSGIRSEAMRWLPRVAGDNAVPQLEELLRTSTDEQTQRSAVSALGSIDTDRARKAIRTLIERTDVAERIRYEAILSLSRERDGRTLGADDVAYLRSLYDKMETPRLREAVLTSVSRIETPETMQFLLGIARNVNETASLRATAMQRLGRMSSVTLDDIARLYDVADARSLREQILYALYQRKEPQAVDKLMEIARRDTDPKIRQRAISLLARRNDPRAKQLLAELIEKP